MSASRPQRPRRSAFELANAVHTNACGSTRDVSRPGKRGSHRPPAVPFRRSHHAPRPWPFTGGGSGRLSRPSGRRRSPCDQCGSTAATEPPRGRPQACWLRAGRRQWTASWALAGEPRALPGNLLAAAVRGAEHRLLAHGPAVQPWLRRSPPTRVRLVSGCGSLCLCPRCRYCGACVPADGRGSCGRTLGRGIHPASDLSKIPPPNYER